MDLIADMADLLDMDIVVHSHAANEFVGLYCKQVAEVTARFESEINSLEFPQNTPHGPVLRPL